MCRAMRGMVVAAGMALAVLAAPMLVAAVELPMDRAQAMQRDLVLAAVILDVQRATPYRAFRPLARGSIRLARDVRVDEALMEELLPATGEESLMAMASPQPFGLSLDPLLDTHSGLSGAAALVSVASPATPPPAVPPPSGGGGDGGGGGGGTLTTPPVMPGPGSGPVIPPADSGPGSGPDSGPGGGS